MFRRAFLFLATLVLSAGCDTGRCLSDGVYYEEVSDDAIINGTCVAEGERFDETYSCEKVEGPCTDHARADPSQQVVDPDPRTDHAGLPSEENNGFYRDETGVPTSDPDRMIAFIERELDRRGE